jgi:hypothetical protein
VREANLLFTIKHWNVDISIMKQISNKWMWRRLFTRVEDQNVQRFGIVIRISSQKIGCCWIDHCHFVAVSRGRFLTVFHWQVPTLLYWEEKKCENWL